MWTSIKLYGYELHLGSKLFWKMICGGQLSYREKKQLSSAVSDTTRLVPFTIFAIIPFSEFALPFVLKVVLDRLRYVRNSRTSCLLLSPRKQSELTSVEIFLKLESTWRRNITTR